MVARWRIFRNTIIALPERVENYTKAAIELHNYLQSTESSTYCPPGFVDGEDGAKNIVKGSGEVTLHLDWARFLKLVVIGM